MSSKIVPDTGEYLMIFSIGTPPTQVQAIVDTGSDLTWVQCIPCKNGQILIPSIFDPSKSSTYQSLSCFHPSCDNLRERRLDCQKIQEPCYYKERYTDGSTTKGTLAYDKFLFEDYLGDIVDVGNVEFGCSSQSLGIFPGNQFGIVGLNRGPLSLVSQLGIKRFAYCMVAPENQGSGGRIYFGSEAVLSGGQTPLVKGNNPDFYFLTLDGISVGDQRIPIPSGTFDMTAYGGGGFMIDAGTQYTSLRAEAHEALVQALRQAIDLPQTRSSRLCFIGTFDDLALQPDVTFHFKGTDVTLMKETTYIKQKDGRLCLAILKSTSLLSMFGNVQQQNYYVGYDLETGMVSFAPVDCNIY
ncbi:Asp domain-containing protein [Cephalotus follicularis]|uniref:Asp domain-containing protein n=1 Tax=Cephalotus follicularis TaxID=3775 RepID=A0A1Q3D4D4_CEPFO|nr:Asp domain-containing protein [Cephalotus follicularis]